MSSSKSYQTILKSSSLIGGSEVVKLLIGIVQVKFVAIFLGPLGVGLIGIYSSVINLAVRIAGLGIGGSGVREVAEAIGTSDNEKIGRTVLTLRRICWITGTVGSLTVVFLAQPLSRITFGTTEHAWALVLLAWIILMRNIQSAQMAYLQGLRRIGDLARLKIIGAAGGATIGVGLYAWLRLDGIVPALLILAAFNLTASWWFARKVPPPNVSMTWGESIRASKGLVRLGLAFMWNGVLTAGVAYLTRLLINLEIGMEAVGIFQSAFRLSGLFVGFILQAMGTDFYPRLTSVAHDNRKVNQLVNEQTEIGLLLAVPGILAILVFAPWIIRIFYTAKFAASAELLQWFVLGCLGRVISWPMGFILLAKGKAGWMVFTETSSNLLHILLIWLGLQYFGIHGVAIAFFILYIIYIIMMKFVSYQLCGFTWNTGVRGLLIKLIPVTAIIFLANKFVPEKFAIPIGVIFTIIAGIYCLRELTRRLGPEHRICRIVNRIPLVQRLV